MAIRFLKQVCTMLLCLCSVFAQAQKDTAYQQKAKHDSLADRIIRKDVLLNAVQQQKSAVVKEIIEQNPIALVQQAGKNLTAPFSSKVKLLTEGKFLQTNKVDLFFGYTYMRDTSGLTNEVLKKTQGIADYSANGEVLMKNIPFTIALDGNNGFYTTEHTPFNNFYKTNFDPQKYKELLQSQVLSKIKPDMILGSILGRINTIRQGYEKSLLGELSGIQKEFTDRFADKLNLPVDVSDLSKADVSSVRNKIFQEVSIEKYNESLARYQEITRNKGLDATDTSIEAKDILREIKKFEALEKVYVKVISSKEKFENNKLVKELKSHLPFTPDKFKAYLNNPGNLTEVIKKYGDISTIQSLFLNLTKLDIGQNPVQSGELNMQGLMNTGVNTALQTKKASAGIIAGANNNRNNWMQSGLNSMVTNEYSGMAGLTLGTGSGSQLNQSVSVNFFNFMRSPGSLDGTNFLQPSYLATAKRQDAVISFHSGFKLTEKHEISVDISRSIGAYKNNMNEDSTYYSKSAAGSVLSNEGKSNFAAAVDYKGEILKSGLQLSVKKVGLGYNNPGNIFLRKGETQLQLGINRKLLKQKLTVKYKTDYRYQHFDPGKNYTYTTFSNKLQLGLRIRRNSRVGISYQRSDYRSKMFMQAAGTGESSILQGDGSYKLNLFKKAVHNTITLNRQSMKLPLAGATYYNSRSVFFVHSSSMAIGQNLLVFSVMANQSDNKEYYFNTSFVNAELSYAYALSEKVRFTSGSGYYINTGWNSQLGIKQQVSINAMKNLDIDIGIDCKKAMRIIRSELANQIFATASVHYRFK